MKALQLGAIALALLASASGCSSDDDDGVVFVGTGVVVIDWTINGAKDPTPAPSSSRATFA